MSRERFKLFDNKPFGIRAAGIVVKDDQILLIQRIKDGKEYYAFPGGGVDAGETIQQAIVREIFEETNQNVTVDHILYHLDYIDDSDQYFGLCRYTGGGELKLNGEEIDRHNSANQYHPQWVALTQLPTIRLLPTEIKDWLLADLPTIQKGEKPFRHQRAAFMKQSL